nr:MAG TPA: hypothetical protein [Bacteriophage sp.]
MSLKAEITANIVNKVHIAMGEYSRLQFKIVDELPETGEENIVYLVPSKDPSQGDLFEEYIWINGAWEKIGNIDLRDYYTKEQIDAMLTDYLKIDDATKRFQPLLEDYVDINVHDITANSINSKNSVSTSYQNVSSSVKISFSGLSWLPNISKTLLTNWIRKNNTGFPLSQSKEIADWIIDNDNYVPGGNVREDLARAANACNLSLSEMLEKTDEDLLSTGDKLVYFSSNSGGLRVGPVNIYNNKIGIGQVEAFEYVQIKGASTTDKSYINISSSDFSFYDKAGNYVAKIYSKDNNTIMIDKNFGINGNYYIQNMAIGVQVTLYGNEEVQLANFYQITFENTRLTITLIEVTEGAQQDEYYMFLGDISQEENGWDGYGIGFDSFNSDSVSITLTPRQNNVTDINIFSLAISKSLDTKVNKISTTSGYYRTYVITPDGEQSYTNMNNDPVASIIPLWTSERTLRTETPINDKDAVNLEYFNGHKSKLDIVELSGESGSLGNIAWQTLMTKSGACILHNNVYLRLVFSDDTNSTYIYSASYTTDTSICVEQIKIINIDWTYTKKTIDF